MVDTRTVNIGIPWDTGIKIKFQTLGVCDDVMSFVLNDVQILAHRLPEF